MSKGLKIGLIIGIIVLAIIAVYFLFRKGAGNWKAVPLGDVVGGDIDSGVYNSVEEAKKHAAEIGAKSFVYHPAPGKSWFKSLSGPVITSTGGDHTLYIKQ